MILDCGHEVNPIITWDILEGAKGVKDILGWRELTRIILIKGVTIDVTWDHKCEEALEITGLKIGEFSDYPSGAESNHTLILNEIQFNSIEGCPDTIQLVCEYKRASETISSFEDGAIRFSATTSSEEIVKDKDGIVKEVKYQWLATDIDNPFINPATGVPEDHLDIVGALRQAFKPVLAWSVDKKYKISDKMTKKKMKEHIRKYLGSVNKEAWDGNDPRTVLCTGIQAESRDGGLSWEVTYNYEWKSNTWDNVVRYVKSTTGKMINNEELENNSEAEVVCRDYPEEDWKDLPTGEDTVTVLAPAS